MPDESPQGEHRHAGRLNALDGWRAISILLVLACHLVPLGPKSWHANGAAGMTLFFTLSGFLITKTLERNPTVSSFLIRRLCRIVPLTFLALLVYFAILRPGPRAYFAHFLFYENYDSTRLTDLTGHFWSLAVEIHFYLIAALTFALLGVRGLPLLALAAPVITGVRFALANPADIQTHLRVDEILTGVMLALIDSGRFGAVGRAAVHVIRAVPLPAWALLFGLCCWQQFDNNPLMYFRNYASLALVGCTVLPGATPPRLLVTRSMRYIAEVSFAVYVIHSICVFGWFGSGGKTVRYLKRLPALALTFGLAHLSTFYYERPWIAFGKRLANRWDHRPARSAEPRARHQTVA